MTSRGLNDSGWNIQLESVQTIAKCIVPLNSRFAIPKNSFHFECTGTKN